MNQDSISNSQTANREVSAIKQLKLTFNNLDMDRNGYIDKSVLSQAYMYTGDNYDK